MTRLWRWWHGRHGRAVVIRSWQHQEDGNLLTHPRLRRRLSCPCGATRALPAR